MEELDLVFEKARKAYEKYSTFTQEQVDKIFKAAALAANENRIMLAKLAHNETSMGIFEDKILKNHYASEFIYNKYRHLQTVGTFYENKALGIHKVYEPIGIVGAVIPTTNPTATAIFKCLLALKTRNAIVISPHPGAKNCTIEAAKIIYEAAFKAGAPEDIIAWLDCPSLEKTNYVMQNSDIILATGGPGMVKAAYSSGTPSIGVGAGNAPAIIDDSADLDVATSSIVQSNTFDNGVVCATENSLVILESVYDKTIELFKQKNSYIVTSEDEKNKFRKAMFKEGKYGLLNADLVGKSALKVAEIVGIKVPETTRFIIVEANNTSYDEPLAHEKLSTYVAAYKVKSFEEAIKVSREILKMGAGHTASLWCDVDKHKDRLELFKGLNPGRLLVNSPSSLGGVGDMYNFGMDPSMTLGCGTHGKNSFSQNVGPLNLLNVKTIAERRENMQWLRLPERIYHKYGSLQYAFEDLREWDIKKVYIVTDKIINQLYGKRITEQLDKLGISYTVFDGVEPNPMLSTTKKGAEDMKQYRPDLIIGFGGGSSMDAAKLMWLMYENDGEEVNFKDLAVTFADIRKRIVRYPNTGKKAKMLCIPTTSGTGSEVTPFSVITDDETHTKYPLADYSLTPNMAIIDPELTMTVPKNATNAPALDALTHCLEAYVSVMSTEYTDGYAVQGAKNILNYLPRAYKNGTEDVEARAKVMDGATFAGMSFANAFLGLVHSLSHKVGGYHNVIHGAANAILLPHIIRYNAACLLEGGKQTYFSQYKVQNSMEKYAQMARELGLKGKTDEQLVDALIETVQNLTKEVGLYASFKDYGVDEKNFQKSLEKMAEDAFDDQCTGANPRYPLIEDIKQIYLDAYYGNPIKKFS
ncbi:bifunctional acetaldehyde-CoA/alcohol dehydrogenase [Spiroplasma tabanidicola]|uniref:Aldehyde-alcohol dehydrogenase n=1 Tax=Spiroplasma tabanidicola TaxID=324079 RepID=A0A6I6CBJ3_9MOLU|nr:bifunctional acetaldehyde-CoA/alcohol dehydrogenase [Spiroplasma tabanidicola]QGS52335.1 acetaldehyde dehydrogenase [Spiroplasma tabanidicola]